VITQPQVHGSLTYLLEHLPPQLHLILATRADPPLSLSRLRAREQVFEVRTEQLRCTSEEALEGYSHDRGDPEGRSSHGRVDSRLATAGPLLARTH
jgi:LuxR family maltose regulon positive regulatory protein